MKIIEKTPETQEQLESWYGDITGLDVPITAVQGYSYVLSDADMDAWVERTFPERKDEFYTCLGVNTRPREGTYLGDINDAVRRMKKKPVLWD